MTYAYDPHWHVHPARREARARRYARRQWFRRGIGLLAATLVVFTVWITVHFL